MTNTQSDYVIESSLARLLVCHIVRLKRRNRLEIKWLITIVSLKRCPV